MSFRAVIFEWRGTLAATLTEHTWVREALKLLRRPATDAQIELVLEAIRAAGGTNRLEVPGVDADAQVHHRTYVAVFRDAGLDDELAEALYAVDSDARHNPFAADVRQVLRLLHQRGLRLALLSNIHFDVRPAFIAAGLSTLVDVFTLSFEQGVQKPNPLMFSRTLAALEIPASAALMVGDRSRPDGAAVEQGITTLLLPPLTDTSDRRLHHVTALCPATAPIGQSRAEPVSGRPAHRGS